jgi:hypothetical protein
MIRGILGKIKENKKGPEDYFSGPFGGYLKKGFRSRGVLDKRCMTTTRQQ